MKKIFLLMTLAFAMCLTTGCVKVDYSISIDPKGEITYEETQAINFKLIESMGGGDLKEMMSAETIKAAKEKNNDNSEYVEYDDGTFSGYTRTKKYKMDYFTSAKLPDGFDKELKKPITFEKSFLCRTDCKVNLKYDYKKALEASQKNNEEGNNLSQLPISGQQAGAFYDESLNDTMEQMFSAIPGLKPELKLTLKVPKKAKKHNATKVISPTEYQWDLVSEEPVEINLEYTSYDFSTLGILLTLILTFLGAIFAWNKLREI